MTEGQHEFEPGNHLHLGGADAQYLEIWVLSRSEAEDYWDGNWLTCEVRLAAGGFLGRFSANFRTDEFQSFAGQVRTLYHDLKTPARLDCMEDQLRLVLEGDARGHIQCLGHARDLAGAGNLLTFELRLDQTQLFGTMVELEELVNRYPVRGSPAV